jgi:hypothetical protein
MKRFLAAPVLLALLAASPAPKVEVATGDWSGLPPLKFVGYDHLSPKAIGKIDEIRRKHHCNLPGGAGDSTDLSVSFAVQYDQKGDLARLLLPRLNCPSAEAWLGAALLESVQKGDYRSTGENPEGWYQGRLSFQYDN